MPRVYECVQWNEATQSCDVAAWVERVSIVGMLPTVEQAQLVGSWIFGSLVLLASMSLLFPPRSNLDD